MPKPIKLRITNEQLITPGGLATVGHMLSQTSLYRDVDNISVGAGKPDYANSAAIAIAVALMSQGKADFEAINEFHEEPEYYSEILGINGIPSEPTYRQRLKEISEKALPMARKAIIEILAHPKVSFGLYKGYIPIDCDVTPLDNSGSKKEGVSWTYKGHDGYAPMQAYIGTQGYLLGEELRPGSQNGQKDTGAFIKRSIINAKKLTDVKLLLRLDAGNDAKENRDICYSKETHADFIIKRNLRHESIEEWVALAKEESENVVVPREGKTVYTGSTYRFDGNRETRIVYEITERTTNKHGQILLAPEYDVNTFWVSIPDEDDGGWSDADVIQAYHDHATSEQFHAEIKTDMDLERLPSGDFNTNKLIWALGMIAYNILRLMGQVSLDKNDAPLKRPVKRRRIKTVIQNLITIAVRVATHARQTFLNLGRSNAWSNTYIRVHQALTG